MKNKIADYLYYKRKERINRSLPEVFIHWYSPIEFMKGYLIPVKILVELILNTVLMFKRQVRRRKKVCMAIFNAKGLDPLKHNDIFWIFKGATKRQYVYYFRYRKPIKEDISRLKKLDMDYIDLTSFHSLNIFPCKMFIKKLLKRFIYSLGHNWEQTQLLNLADFYETFFYMYNVNIHFSMHETGIDMYASNIAMYLVNGVDMGCQWSITSKCWNKPQDIYFAWYGDLIGHNVSPIEYPYTYSFPETKKRAKKHRKYLKDNGAKFIVAFFDQNFNSQLPKWSFYLELAYLQLLYKVLYDEEFGLIIKPKKCKDLKEKLPHLSSLIDMVLGTGRCLILDGIFPHEVGQASDLAVGFGVDSTAVIESSLAGVKSVAYDPYGVEYILEIIEKNEK